MICISGAVGGLDLLFPVKPLHSMVGRNYDWFCVWTFKSFRSLLNNKLAANDRDFPIGHVYHVLLGIVGIE